MNIDLQRMFEAKRGEARRVASKLKDPSMFDLRTVPSKIYLRRELEGIVSGLAQYSELKLPCNYIIFGSRGSGKTVTILYMLRVLGGEGKLKTFYVKAREHPSSYRIYMAMCNVDRVGYSPDMLRRKALQLYGEGSVIVVDDADFLEDFNFIYTFTRESNASIILLTQNIQLINRIDESTYSSMQPTKIYFADYKPEEIYEILRMRAEAGLYSWSDEALRLIAAIIVRDYRSDTRIAIKTLLKTAVNNDWSENGVRRAAEEASREVESMTLRELKDRDVIALYVLTKYRETSNAYKIFNTYMARFEGRFLTKPTFFRTLNYLQNLGLITQVRKRVGRSYTIEVDMLIDEKTIQNEIMERFGGKLQL